MPEPEGEDFKKAVSVLLPYLLSHRTRLASLEDSSDGAEYSAIAVRAGDFMLKTPTVHSIYRSVPSANHICNLTTLMASSTFLVKLLRQW